MGNIKDGDSSQRERVSHDELDDPWQKNCIEAGQFVWQVGKWHILSQDFMVSTG